MANTVTLSIKTTPAIKAQIQEAAEQLGLSINSFVIMVAKNAVDSDEIVIKRRSTTDEAALIDRANDYNADHEATASWSELKTQYGL